MEETNLAVFANINAVNYKKLKDNFPSIDVDMIIEKKVKYYRMKPFKTRTKMVWIDEIKEYLELVNEDFKEEKEEKPKQIKEETKQIIKQAEEIDEDEIRIKIREAYESIKEILEKYLDLKKEYYTILALWIIGTWIHNSFKTFPYLFINAMRGSGKTRLLKLISNLSYEGCLQSSLTEAVLFRTKGTLCIDEFEGVNRKGNENLKELLNTAYKSGLKIKRMKKQRSMAGEEQVVEVFEPYRPIVLANIWGMEEVLSDRCFTLVLEKSFNSAKTKLIEDFEENDTIINILRIFNEASVVLCRVVTSGGCNVRWNSFIFDKYSSALDTLNDTTTLNEITYKTTLNNTKEGIKRLKEDILFNKIDKSNINGRGLELSFPLFMIANFLSEEILDETVKIIEEIVGERREEEFSESRDVSFIDFISQFPEDDSYVSLSRLTEQFKQFIQEDESEEKWINSRWIGRALKRLNLIIRKRRLNKGREVVPNIAKAQEKIKMFK